jgi:hypothetical protein
VPCDGAVPLKNNTFYFVNLAGFVEQAEKPGIYAYVKVSRNLPRTGGKMMKSVPLLVCLLPLLSDCWIFGPVITCA